MNASSQLFELIKSMTQSEKRYFKVFSGRQVTGDKNQYTQLFEWVDRQSKYDESKIVSGIRDKKFKRQFSVVKNYLYHQILKALSEYHSSKNHHMQIHELFKQLSVLYNRGLYSQAGRLLNRIVKLAEVVDRGSVWLEVWYWRLELTIRSDNISEHEQFQKDFTRETDALLRKIENLGTYQVLGSEVALVMKRKGDARDSEVRNQLEHILKHPLLQNESASLSPKATFNFHNINSFINTLLGNQEEAYKHRQRLLKLYENNDGLIIENTEQYILNLNNFIASAFRTNRYEDAEEGLHKMRSLPARLSKSQFKKIEVRLFTYLPDLEMFAYVNEGNFDLASQVADAVIDRFPDFENKLSLSTRLVFYGNLSYSFFGMGRFDDSLFWINKILNETRDFTRENLHAQARIFDLLLHFELENFDLLDYKIRSTYRYLLKKQQLFKVEEVILRYLRKSVNVVSPSTFRSYCESFLEELRSIPKNALEQEMLKRFNLPAWLESKVLGITFAEVVKVQFASY